MGIWGNFRARFSLAEAPRGSPDLQERGDTGMGFWGFVDPGTSRRIRDLEYLHDLQGMRCFPIYDRMRKSDPKVDGLLSVRKLPLMKAEWRIESADPKSAAANKIAEFVRENLFERMAYSWHSVLWEIMLHADYGYAPFETVWAKPDGKKQRIDRLALRPPSTIWWIWGANGRVEKVEQSVFGHWLTIPGEKLVWFVHRREGENWRGCSMLRPMHKPWYAKERLEILELILAERGGGIPVFKMGASAEASKSLKAKIDNIIQNFRMGEQMGMRLPPDVDFTLETPTATLKDIHEMKVYHDQQMSNVAIAQVLDLGKTATGSRSLGMTLADMLIDACEAEANSIEDTINQREGLIWQLVTYNFGEDPETMPKLRSGKLGKVDALSFGQGIKYLADAGVRLDDKLTVEYLRDLLGLPAVDADEISSDAAREGNVQENEPANITDLTPKPGTPKQLLPAAAGGQSLKDQVAAAKTAVGEVKADVSKPSTPLLPQQVRIRGAEGGYWREPRGVELFCDLSEIGTVLDDAKTAVKTVTQGVRDKLGRELLARARSAQAAGTMSQFLAQRPPMVDVLQGKVMDVLSGFYAKGRRTVADELQRQRDGQTVAQQIAQREAGVLHTAEVRLAGPPTPGEAGGLGAAAGLIRQYAEAIARQIADAVKHAAAAAALRSVTSDVKDEAALAAVNSASDAAALRAAAAATNLFQQGRGEEALAASDVANAVYSALLDGVTCEECEPLDGEESTDIADAVTWTPNPNCLGEAHGNSCRCLVIFEIAQTTGQDEGAQ